MSPGRICHQNLTLKQDFPNPIWPVLKSGFQGFRLRGKLWSLHLQISLSPLSYLSVPLLPPWPLPWCMYMKSSSKSLNVHVATNNSPNSGSSHLHIYLAPSCSVPPCVVGRHNLARREWYSGSPLPATQHLPLWRIEPLSAVVLSPLTLPSGRILPNSPCSSNKSEQ